MIKLHFGFIKGATLKNMVRHSAFRLNTATDTPSSLRCFFMSNFNAVTLRATKVCFLQVVLHVFLGNLFMFFSKCHLCHRFVTAQNRHNLMTLLNNQRSVTFVTV